LNGVPSRVENTKSSSAEKGDTSLCRRRRELSLRSRSSMRSAPASPPWYGALTAETRSAAPAPERSSTTAQGDPRTIFKRAIEKGSRVIAEATAKEIGELTVAEALELTALVARKEPERFDRYAVRWLARYLDETSDRVTVVRLRPDRELSALAGPGREQALEVLRGASAAR
jgi:hypothetical protein